MNYDQALEFLDSFIDYEKDRSFDYPEAFKLDRMRALAKEFGNPQNSFESVLIAGSKGKGSTAVLLSSILRMENLKVGLYTSPHLQDVRERIQVNGLWINELRLTEFVGRMKKVMDQYSWKKNPPTYFEILTMLSFVHFKEMKVQAAVLEVGLGGLYDSTNIVIAKVAGLTPISLEHTDKLGKTLSKIAVQKCGIIKGRETVVSAPQTPEAQSVIKAASEEREADLYRLGREIRVTERDFDEDAQKFDLKTPWGSFYDLEIRLRGRHQLDNAGVAVGLAKALEKRARLPVSDVAVRQGLLDAHWPGRLEKISERPKIVLDGAHNVDSVKKMLEAVRRHFHFSDLIVVFAVSSDKDAEGMLREIRAHSDHIILTQFSHPRAESSRALAEKAPSDVKKTFIVPDSRSALLKAKSLAGPEDLILVTGSLFLVAELRAAVMGGL